MNSVVVMVVHVIADQPAEMSLIERDDIVNGLPAAASDPALRDSILRRNLHIRALRLEAGGLQEGDDIAVKIRVVRYPVVARPAAENSDWGAPKILYCFFVMEHGRRRILHFNHQSSDDGLRFQDCQNLRPSRPKLPQGGLEQTIKTGQGGARPFPFEYSELLSQRKSFKRGIDETADEDADRCQECGDQTEHESIVVTPCNSSYDTSAAEIATC